MLLFTIANCAVFLDLDRKEFSRWTYMTMLLWGMQDNAIFVHISQILGHEFEEAETSFSAFNFVQNLAVFICVTFQGCWDMKSLP